MKEDDKSGGGTDDRYEIIVDQARVVSVLSDLGLTQDAIHRAIQLAYGEAFNCTAHDPRGLPGQIAYGKIVRHLRDIYVPEGWSMQCLNNVELTIHPDGDLAFVVWGGTSDTGLFDGVPTNRNPKGRESNKLTTMNQASFADYLSTFPRRSESIVPGKTCWVLLHFHDRVKDELRAELSYPLAYWDGHVRSWGRRIILGSVPVGPAPFPPDEDEGDDGITVERRTG